MPEAVGMGANQSAADNLNNHIENGKLLYDRLVSNNVAKEMARIHLPLALNTTLIWTGSLYSYFHLR
jgi:thymidylate synthase ThyX